MKRKKVIVCGLLLVLMLHINTMPLFAASEATTTIADIFATNITTSGSQVTLTVGVKKDAKVTSGKIVVSYDESMMTVSFAKGNNIWEMEDINTLADKDDKKAVSYAWVNSQLENAEGTMLTVTFQGTAAAAGKEVSVQTNVVELYQGDNEVSVPNRTVTDTVKMPADIGKNTGSDVDKNMNRSGNASDDVVVVSENDGAKLTAKAQAKKTGDETNVAGYVLLLGAAVVVLAEAARKKIKKFKL